MKKPDEIKKALECCFYDSEQCADCPYYPVSCDRELVRDAREYIQQLEAERDALIHDIEEYFAECALCKHYTQGPYETPCNSCKHMHTDAVVSMWEWRGVQKEG